MLFLYIGAVDVFKGSCNSLKRFTLYHLCHTPICLLQVLVIMKKTSATLVNVYKQIGGLGTSVLYTMHICCYKPKVTQLCMDIF